MHKNGWCIEIERRKLIMGFLDIFAKKEAFKFNAF